jgi:hypothetical protein
MVTFPKCVFKIEVRQFKDFFVFSYGQYYKTMWSFVWNTIHTGIENDDMCNKEKFNKNNNRKDKK